MRASFHPDGTAQLSYCARCERAALEKLVRFDCLPKSGIIINPGLHTTCAGRVKGEIRAKLSLTFKRYMNDVYGPIGNPLASVVKLSTGIEL